MSNPDAGVAGPVLTASVRRRAARRRLYRFTVPVISPYTDRLREAAVGGHLCGPLMVAAVAWVPFPDGVPAGNPFTAGSA